MFKIESIKSQDLSVQIVLKQCSEGTRMDIWVGKYLQLPKSDYLWVINYFWVCKYLQFPQGNYLCPSVRQNFITL